MPLVWGLESKSRAAKTNSVLQMVRHRFNIYITHIECVVLTHVAEIGPNSTHALA